MTSNMPRVAITYGLVLIAIGLAGYFGTGQTSMTALIPAFLGIVAALCGFVGRNERYLKHAMHGAAMVGLLGVLGTLRVLPQLPSLFSGAAERPAAVLVQALTLLLSVIFVVLCVRSFVETRRARQAGG